MSVRLSVGDAVLVQINKDHQVIGSIKYIGPLVDNLMREYVGVELVEPIDNGHNGTINDFTYFTAIDGHGFHCKLTNIIRKLLVSELVNELRKQLQYIQKLESNLNINIPSSVTTKVCQQYKMPKRQSLSSNNMTVTDSKIESIIHTKKSTSSMIDSDCSAQSDDTDHECSLSSSYTYSDTESLELNNKKKTKISKKFRKRKSLSLSSSESNSNVLPTPYSKMSITLKQSHTQIFGGNIDVSYNSDNFNGYTHQKPMLYIKYNEYNHKNLPSLSAMSKSPKISSVAPKQMYEKQKK